MKSLSSYMEEGQTRAFEENGAFFAFGNEQFNEKRVVGIDYISISSGLICPKENCEKLINELRDIENKAIKQDIEENGIDNIIKRELSNHECYYSHEIDDAVSVLSDYDGIDAEKILQVLRNH